MKNITWESVKCFVQVHVENVHHSSLVHPCCKPEDLFCDLSRYRGETERLVVPQVFLLQHFKNWDLCFLFSGL